MTSKGIVFDTNVLISALLFADATPARAFFTTFRHNSIFMSMDTLQELQTVLQRKQVDTYVRHPRLKLVGLCLNPKVGHHRPSDIRPDCG